MLKKIIAFVFIAALLGTGAYWFVLKDSEADNNNSQTVSGEPLHTITNNEGTKFKHFTPQEFSDLYNGFAYPNTMPIKNNFSVTENDEADEIINELAESVGYKVRSAPVTDNFVDIGGERLVQRIAAESWKDLVKEAKKNDIDLRVTEGFRSAEDQNRIFIDRLGNISPDKIIDRSSDSRIEELLKTTAPAGYSRHHTGYTVDLACDSDPNVLFENSICFKWISGSNYINVKKFGWIPSYPEGIKNQGPDPESWEYVWVGLSALKE